MAADTVQSVGEQLKQLNEARKAILVDPTYYKSIMNGILPLAAPNSTLELRRWAADFIAEAFATPTLPNKDKEVMSFQVLPVLRSLLESPKEDTYVLRSVIAASASIFPHVLRWMYVSAFPSSQPARARAVRSLVLVLATTSSCWLPNYTALEQAPPEYFLSSWLTPGLFAEYTTRTSGPHGII
jgi:symplekin